MQICISREKSINLHKFNIPHIQYTFFTTLCIMNNIGILDKEYADNRYGSKFYATLSRDLRHEMPEVEGLSETSIRYAKRFYNLYCRLFQILPQAVEESERSNLPQAVENLYSELFSIPWGHHRFIIDKCSNNPDKALFYVRQTLENGWSRNILLNMLRSNLSVDSFL